MPSYIMGAGREPAKRNYDIAFRTVGAFKMPRPVGR